MIEWQMEQGHNSAIRRRHAYVLSGPLLFPSVPPTPPHFLCSPSPHPALHQPAAAASCSLLPHLPLSSALLSGLMNTSHYCFANYWFHSNDCWWPKHECPARYCMIKTRVIYIYQIIDTPDLHLAKLICQPIYKYESEWKRPQVVPPFWTQIMLGWMNKDILKLLKLFCKQHSTGTACSWMTL